MREDNLLCLRKPLFRPATTDSRHGWRVWPNLARHMVPMAINQLWVADITYVRLAEAFVYLAVVLDAFSRKVVGWAMADHLRPSWRWRRWTWRWASRDGRSPGGLVHHSDRGVAICLRRLYRPAGGGRHPAEHEPGGCPYDNAMAESFMKTLKQEEVDGRRLSRPGACPGRDRHVHRDRSTTASGSTRPWPICHRRSTKQARHGLLRSSPWRSRHRAVPNYRVSPMGCTPIVSPELSITPCPRYSRPKLTSGKKHNNRRAGGSYNKNVMAHLYGARFVLSGT